MHSRRRSDHDNGQVQPNLGMQPPVQQQSYTTTVYYAGQQTFPENRRSIMKPAAYDTVTQQSGYGKYQD